jgi:hypothetical protein
MFSTKARHHLLGTRSSFAGVISTGRNGWSQGRGEEASSWFIGFGSQRGCITRARSMFCGELQRPNGNGVINVGERSSLLAAQVAVEQQALRFGQAVVKSTTGRRTRTA